ncbi:ribosomal protection-like ABC-F family protein [Leptolyngbya sp. FACHB-261]|uniref:ribosomal protection-like ABC-F family protein n=1 Tax=Leptolyngbya sp. FACHB-261 TaxID=2692806 RepID=UPI001685BBD7|nr:ABC-F family ATP-binding cassette domain-containing protein [Leptolyngbya sp. FACHB-261]MBD2104039.1 ABC-F family ATP-binding cassette domain-containing protein [Leptolyngbya sp. FACHB-261]
MLHVQNLQVNFGLQEVLKRVSFDLNPGEVMAITGPNGSGKSTLLKCIVGLLLPSAGTIQQRRDLTLAFLPQERALEPQLAMEFLLLDCPNVRAAFQRIQHCEASLDYADAIHEYAEAGGYELETKLKRLLPTFGFCEPDLLRPLASFSEGQQQIWSIIRLFLSNSTLLVLDEPTNHLDIAMQLYLEAAIRREKQLGRSFLVVSHDRVLIDQIADQTLYLNQGEAVIVQGGYSQVLAHLDQDFRSRQEHAQEIQRKIKHLEQEALRKKVWSNRKEKEKIGALDKGFIGARAAKLAKRAKVVEHRQTQMIEQLKQEKPFVEKKIKLAFEPYVVTKKWVFLAQNLSKRLGKRQLFHNLNLELMTQDRVGIVGPNGSGKTTLVNCLLGHSLPDAGQIKRNESVHWLYIPQDVREYFREEILLDNFKDYGLEEPVVRQFLGAAKLRRDRVVQPISTLSAGELMRAAIVSVLLAKAEFLLLDEPTNHLDIESLEVLDDLLSQFPGGLLFISHDRRFIARHAEQIFSFREERLLLTP